MQTVQPTFYSPKNQKLLDQKSGLVEYLTTLKAIKMDKPIAKLNATSISDNNGGRIFL